jgi:hypothetical protein
MTARGFFGPAVIDELLDLAIAADIDVPGIARRIAAGPIRFPAQ